MLGLQGGRPGQAFPGQDDEEHKVDPIVAVLLLVMMTATAATIFSLVRRKGEGGAQLVLGIALGWVLFLSPIMFFGNMGAITGIILVFLVGGLVAVLGSRYDRQMRD